MRGLELRPHTEWLVNDDGNPWLVDGMVHDGATLWVAKRGVGKSLLTVDLAVSLARGDTEWLGRDIRPGNGRVVFLVSDPKAERETARRLDAMGTPDGSVEIGRLRRGPEPAEQWAELARELKGSRLVVVDSGTNLVHDTVKAEYTNPLFDGLNEIVAENIPVLLVHHIPKSGTLAAGNYGWEAWPRWWMYMGASGENFRTLVFEGNENDDGLPRTVVVRMPRKTHPASRFTLADDRAAESEIRTLARQGNHAKLLTHMRERSDWRSQAHIAAELGISQSVVSRILTANGLRLTNGQVTALGLAS
jgi:AAA domain